MYEIFYKTGENWHRQLLQHSNDRTMDRSMYMMCDYAFSIFNGMKLIYKDQSNKITNIEVPLTAEDEAELTFLRLKATLI
jgi:hypothetical protein